MNKSSKKRMFKRAARRTERQGSRPGHVVTNQNIKSSIYELGQAITQIGHVVGVLVELAGKDAVQAKAEEITARIAAEKAKADAEPKDIVEAVERTAQAIADHLGPGEPTDLDKEIAEHNAAVDARKAG